MTGEVLLVGPLAHPALFGVLGLSGLPEVIEGRLIGGGKAGIADNDWPRYYHGDGRLTALRVNRNPKLDRYAAVMGLRPVNGILGVQNGGDDSEEWAQTDWSSELPAELARIILEQPADQQSDQIRKRLPMLAVWAASRLRAADGPVPGGSVVARRGESDVQWHEMSQPYAGFFAVQKWRLSHATHAGGMMSQILREGFIVGDAVVVLPWDPVRDRVLVVEQFRLAPALRHDPQPWMLEAIAGRIDAGETPEEAARREAVEEAGLQLNRLIPTSHYYPSPGAVAEYLYSYIAITDLPDGIAGTYGLPEESEDIKGHLLDRAMLTQMLHAGQISNGPLAMLILWLEVRAVGLRNQ